MYFPEVAFMPTRGSRIVAAHVAKVRMENSGRLPVEIAIASEFLCWDLPLSTSWITMVVTQAGEELAARNAWLCSLMLRSAPRLKMSRRKLTMHMIAPLISFSPMRLRFSGAPIILPSPEARIWISHATRRRPSRLNRIGKETSLEKMHFGNRRRRIYRLSCRGCAS